MWGARRSQKDFGPRRAPGLLVTIIILKGEEKEVEEEGEWEWCRHCHCYGSADEGHHGHHHLHLHRHQCHHHQHWHLHPRRDHYSRGLFIRSQSDKKKMINIIHCDVAEMMLTIGHWPLTTIIIPREWRWKFGHQQHFHTSHHITISTTNIIIDIKLRCQGTVVLMSKKKSV